MVIRTAAAFLAVVFFGLLLELPKRYLFHAGLVGGAAWLVYLFVEDWTASKILAALISTLAVAVISHIFARMLKAPVTVFLVAGILPAVPGASIYRSVYYVIQDERVWANYYLMETLQIAGAMAMAVFITDSVFRLIQERERRRSSRRSDGNSGTPDWKGGPAEGRRTD